MVSQQTFGCAVLAVWGKNTMILVRVGVRAKRLRLFRRSLLIRYACEGLLAGPLCNQDP